MIEEEREEGIRSINRPVVRPRWFNLRICVFGLARGEIRERKRNPGDQGPGDLREDTRQASGFGVVACKTTERYLSVARFDPVGSGYPFIVSPRKNRVLARGKRYKYFNKHSTVPFVEMVPHSIESVAVDWPVDLRERSGLSILDRLCLACDSLSVVSRRFICELIWLRILLFIRNDLNHGVDSL